MNSSLNVKRPKVCGNKCVVCGKSKFSNPGLKLFIFPRRDPGRCDKWIESTRYYEFRHLPLEAKRYVCELHFNDNDFMSKLRSRLMPNAVPIKNNVNQYVLVKSPTLRNAEQKLKLDSKVRINNDGNMSKDEHSQCQATLQSFMTNNTPLLPEAISKNHNINTITLEGHLQPQSHTYKISSLSENQSWQQCPNQEYVTEPIIEPHYTLTQLTETQPETYYVNINENVQTEHVANENTQFVAEEIDQSKLTELIANNHVPMIQPYFKRKSKIAACKYCKRKDKTVMTLRKRLRELKRITLKDKIDKLKNISRDSKTFAKMFLTHGSHRVWSEDEKTFAIDLLSKSSSAYYFLRHNKKMILPSKASVQSWIKERTKDSPENQSQISDTAISIINNVCNVPITSTDVMSQHTDNIISHVMDTQSMPLVTLENTQIAQQHNQHMHTMEPQYKLAYQIITQEGAANKSTYIIHLNEG